MDCAQCPAMAEIRAMFTEILSLLQPKKCSAKDIAILERLLPAIGGRFGSSSKTTAEILADPAIRALSGSLQASGALLSRAADDALVISGLQVSRAGKEHNKTLWQVVRSLPQTLDSNRGRCFNGNVKQNQFPKEKQL